MIDANQDFLAALAQPQKRALFALEIPAFGITITNFLESEDLLSAPITTGGWGNFLWGVAPWGS